MAAAKVLIAALLALATFTVVSSLTFCWGTGMLGRLDLPYLQWWFWLTYDGENADVAAHWIRVGGYAGLVPVAAGVLVEVRQTLAGGSRRTGRQAVVRGATDNHGTAAFVSVDHLRRRFAGASPLHGAVVVGEAYRVDQDPVAQRGAFDPRNARTWGQGGKVPLLLDPCTQDSGHGICYAGSGGYKTVCIASTMCTWTGSAVWLDPSLELGPMGAAAREALGHAVHQLDPTTPGSGFNALAWIDPTRADASLDILSLTAWVCGEERARGKDVIFDDAGRNLVACLLADIVWDRTLAPENRTLRTFVDRISLAEADLRQLLRSVAQNSASSLARRLAPGLMELPEQTFGGVMFNATTFASWLYHDQNLAFLSEGSFDPRLLTTSRVSVFVQPSIEALIRTPGLARVVTGVLATICMDNADPDAPRVLFDIDECARLGNMQIFELIRDVGRKYGPVLRLWYQSEGQLKETWGPQSTTKWYENMSYRSYAAIQSLETAREISGIGGTFGVVAYSQGKNRGSNASGLMTNGSSSAGWTESRHEISRPLVRPEQVITARSDEQFLIVRGMGLARCGRAISFRRPEFTAKLSPSRFYRSVA